jgi:hypothetical protein
VAQMMPQQQFTGQDGQGVIGFWDSRVKGLCLSSSLRALESSLGPHTGMMAQQRSMAVHQGRRYI